VNEAPAVNEAQQGGRKHPHRQTRHGRNKKRGLKKTKRHHHDVRIRN